jgi:DNA-binding transcriptional MerR regulator
MRYLDITTVAKQSGVAASALRYYEAKGLIRSVGRHGLKRLFDAAVLERLALIALGQAAGFSLDELAGMFTADGHAKIERKTLAAKAEELELTIQRLCSMRDGLRHAAVCPAPSHLECPSFRRLMQAAAVGRDVGSRDPSARRIPKAPSLARTRKTIASR